VADPARFELTTSAFGGQPVVATSSREGRCRKKISRLCHVYECSSDNARVDPPQPELTSEEFRLFQRCELLLCSQRASVSYNLNCKEISVKRHYNPRTKSFHIHDLSVDVIRLITVLAAEVGLPHADIVEMGIRRYRKGR
jgi:hypothetical protein